MIDHKTIFTQALQAAVAEGVGSVYGSPQPAENDERLYGLEGIISTIYLKNDVVGKMTIFIRGNAAAKVVAAMLGVEDLPEDSYETLDGIGEVLNIVVGCFKKRLAQHNVGVEISVPSTRLTSIMPPSRWENNIEQVFVSSDVHFKVILSYRIATKEDKAADKDAPPKPKLSAALLLKLALAKKKA